MAHPISVRLDEDIQATLEAAARERGIGLSTYLRDVAAREARRLQRGRIRAQSRAVADYVASSSEADEFYADWGTPTASRITDAQLTQIRRLISISIGLELGR